MTIQHKGIDHLTALAAFSITFAAALKKANEDGSIGWRDALALWPVVKEAPGAFKDIGEVPKELADLDPEEAEKLVQAIEARFPEFTDKGHMRDIVDASLGLVPQLANLFQVITNPPPVAQPA